MDLEFDIDPEIFHERKRRRITEMNSREPPPLKTAPTSQPGVHEIATFLPGRLEFEHEIDNEAEDLVKDLEFGVVSEYGGDQMVEDQDDLDVKARAKWLEDRRLGLVTGNRDPPVPAGKGYMVNGAVNGYHANGDTKKLKSEDPVDDEVPDEAIHPQPYETKESLAFKLTILEMYFQRIEKRLESKAIIFDRGLLEYKKVCRSIRVYVISYFLILLLSRSKRRKRNDKRKRKNFCTVFALLLDYKLRKITRLLPQICSVSGFVISNLGLSQR
jgi:transcriptional adapter 2-alpha